MSLLTDDRKKNESNLKTITFRLDSDLVDTFKSMCKQNKIKQATIIRNALRMAIKEMEKYDNEK